MAEPNLLTNDRVVTDLSACMLTGERSNTVVPKLLKRILREDMWRERIIKTGEVVRFENFEEFVTARPIKGLGESLDSLRRFCREDLEACDLIDRVTSGRQGKRNDLLPTREGVAKPGLPENVAGKPKSSNTTSRNDFVDNINKVELLERPTGTSRQQAIRKLRKDRPDLHERVLAKEITPNAAMVEAGFRHKPTTLAILRKAWAKATDDERDAFKAEFWY